MKLDATFSVAYNHRLRCTRDTFKADNGVLVDLIESVDGNQARVVAFVDAGVAEAIPRYLDQIRSYFKAHENRLVLVGEPHVLPGGEVVKSDRKYLDKAIQIVSEAHLCRQSYVLAIGGGAVLDAVGLATSLAHRGLRLIRVATTTLSQSDSALGVKNGVNVFGQKNYLGVYDVPWAVIHDEATLSFLDDRNWISGFSEAVKVALLKDATLFNDIERHASDIATRNESVAIPVIRASAKHHFDHITLNGDPFERGEARPLDFGHWAAHKLEHMTQYELLHGEAVAIGLALDVTYARLQGWLDAREQERILDCLNNLGFVLYHPAMEQTTTLLAGLADFQEHLGGVRAIPMIRAIGDAFDVNEIDEAVMGQSIARLRDWSASAVQSGRNIA